MLSTHRFLSAGNERAERFRPILDELVALPADAAFVDLFRDPIQWRDILRGVGLQGIYVLVFLGAAWANLATRDITR